MGAQKERINLQFIVDLGKLDIFCGRKFYYRDSLYTVELVFRGEIFCYDEPVTYLQITRRFYLLLFFVGLCGEELGVTFLVKEVAVAGAC